MSGLLDAVEDASPVEAVEAVTRRIGLALGAAEVSFLVADLSGRGLVRLKHIPSKDSAPAGVTLEPADADGHGERRDARELATNLPFDGGPAERALRTQAVQVLPPLGLDGDLPRLWTVLAPVTERGEPLGLLELLLPDEPASAVLEEIAGYLAYLDEVREDAAAKLRFNLLLDQEARIEPMIKAAQARLEKLSEMDPFVLTLLSGGSIRLEWTDMELAKKRRLIRAVMAPRINRIGKGWAGRKGINYERVEPGWR